MSRPRFLRPVFRPHDHRTLIACFVRDPSVTAKKGQFIRQPTHFFAFASLRRGRVGYTLRVQYLYPKCHSPTQSVCALSKESARSPLIAGPRYVVAPSLLKLLIRTACHSDARCATKLAAQSSDAATALLNITSRAHGLAGTSSALRSKR